MKAEPATETAIRELLESFRENYENKDVEALSRLFMEDADAMVIGTGLNEKRIGLEEIKNQFRKDFTQAERLSVNFKNLNISEARPAAWAAGDAVLNFKVSGNKMTAVLRFSAIFEQRNDAWKFAHAHFSIPYNAAPMQEPDPSLT